MEPFRFFTEAQTALDAVSAREALALARRDDLPIDTQSRLLAGVAGRPDLRAGDIKTILSVVHHNDHSTIPTLLANPALRARPKLHAAARRHISVYVALKMLSHLDDAEEYLPELLTTGSGDQSLDNILSEEIAKRFTTAQIGAGVDRIIDAFEAEVTGAVKASQGVRSLSGLDPMSEDQLHRVTDLIVAALDGPAPMWPGGRTDCEDVAEQALITLLQRSDLPDEDCLRLVQTVVALVERDSDPLMLDENVQWHIESRTRRLLSHANLTPEAAALAFTSPVLRLAPSILGRVGPEVVCAAILAGASRPLTLLSDFLPLGRVPVGVVAIVLDSVKAGEVHQPYGPQGRGYPAPFARNRWDILFRVSVDHIGTDYWDDLYAAYLDDCLASGLSKTEAIDSFTLRVTSAIDNWADKGATLREHVYAAWASRSADAYLRAQSVQFCWEHRQLVAAGGDPAMAVRLRVLAHPLALVSDIARAIADESPTVRLAAVMHELAHPGLVSSLGDDPSPRVRAAAARRTMDTLRAPVS